MIYTTQGAMTASDLEEYRQDTDWYEAGQREPQDGECEHCVSLLDNCDDCPQEDVGPEVVPSVSALATRALQAAIIAHKHDRGFNTTNVPLEFCLLQGEVAEAFDAWRKGHDHLPSELADVAVYLLGLAEILGVDLGEAIDAKMHVNAARRYKRNDAGTLIKVPDPEDAE